MAGFARQAVVAFCVMSLLPATQPVQAGGCHQYFNNYYKQAVAVAAVPVYQVGTDLEVKAAVEKALREREQSATAAQKQQLRDTQQRNWEAERIGTPASPAGPSGNLIGATLKAKCARCHETAKSPAGDYWDMSKGITSEQFRLSTAWIAGKKISQPLPKQMEPVVQGLKPEDYGKLLDELLTLSEQAPTAVVADKGSESIKY